jgi:hypothetical protein
MVVGIGQGSLLRNITQRGKCQLTRLYHSMAVSLPGQTCLISHSPRFYVGIT